MDKHIRILDCTLRDGGHINQGIFGEEVIKNIIKRLVYAKIDIIEIGFLWDKEYDTNTARYYNIADVKRILPKNKGVSKFSLMADFIDLEHLEENDGTIDYIRLSFKRHRLEWALKTARLLMDKGYKCFINPVNCNVYTDTQYIELIEKVNELNPYGFSIVDTFGVMRKNDLSRIYYLVNNNLNPNICIGLHLHENLGLAYSLAQHFIEISNPTRNIIVDCSLLGMGRVPGNLCTEQIMDHLNLQYGKAYTTEPALDAIDDYIAPIKAENPWGYSIPYALSAKYSLHRTYAEYLIGKRRLKTKDIQRILSNINANEAEMFNETYVENLYKKYMNVEIDSTDGMIRLSKKLDTFKKILIIAPGSSIKENRAEIQEFVEKENPCVIAINFVPEMIHSDFVFCTNIKRYDRLLINNDSLEIIVTSNLLKDEIKHNYAFSYNDLVYFNEMYCDDSTLMMLNILKRLGVSEISVAGFDGANNNTLNFFDPLFERKYISENSNFKIKDILKKSFSGMKIDFITLSQYADYMEE